MFSKCFLSSQKVNDISKSELELLFQNMLYILGGSTYNTQLLIVVIAAFLGDWVHA